MGEKKIYKAILGVMADVGHIGKDAVVCRQQRQDTVSVCYHFPVVQGADAAHNNEQNHKKGSHGGGNELDAQLFDHEMSSRE